MDSQASANAYETYLALEDTLLTLLQKHARGFSPLQRARMMDLGNQNPEFVAEIEQSLQKKIQTAKKHHRGH